MASRAAPWRSLFETHLRSMASPQFVLSTLAAAAPGAATPYAPRARYCIFRGFWAELPDDARNPAPRNPRAYASDCMTFTTDVRMDKLAHIFGLGTRAEDMEPKDPRASGGGGPVEAVWWAEGPGTQWRVRGRAYVVADDIDDPAAQAAAGPSAVKRELASRMRVADEDKTRDWSWSRELTVAFGNQSPGIRGSFRAPPPGQPLSQPYDSKNLRLGEKVTDLHDPIARANFRLVVIVPDEVEQTNLSDPEKATRFRYVLDEAPQRQGEWTTEELWP